MEPGAGGGRGWLIITSRLRGGAPRLVRSAGVRSAGSVGRHGRADGRRAAIGRLPILTSLAGYRRAWLIPDLVAGLTLVAIAVPEQMATATLAGVAPVVGLYVFLGAAVGFALVGASPQLSVGADSTIAPVMAAGLAALGAATAATAAPATASTLLPLLAVMVGLTLVAVGLARLGWIADLLSRPVTAGFISGIAVTIVIGQLPQLLGVAKGGSSPIDKLTHVAAQLDHVSLPTIAVTALVLVIVIGGERLAERSGRHIPGALLALVACLVLSAVLDLQHHGVSVVGALSAGLPPVALPTASLTTVLDLAPLAGAVALLCVTQTAATTRTFAELGDYAANVNRDLVGVGVGSVLAGVLGGFAANASPPRTAVVVQAGGRTQLGGLAASLLVLLLILFATGLLAGLPEATLGGVLLAVAVRIFQGRELVEVWRFNRWEFALAIACLLTVALVGVLQGIGLAVLLAVLDRTRISARPRDAILGRVPGTTIWWAPNEDPSARPVQGLLVYRFDAPLYFANASWFRGRLLAAVGDAQRPHGPADDSAVGETSARPRAAASAPAGVAAAVPGPGGEKASVLRLVVLDAGAVTDVDYTGVETLGNVIDELKRRGIGFALARATGRLPEQLAASGVMARIGRDHIFESVDQAVTALLPSASGSA